MTQSITEHGQSALVPTIPKINVTRPSLTPAGCAAYRPNERRIVRPAVGIVPPHRSYLEEQLHYLLQVNEDFSFAVVLSDVLQVTAELRRRRQERKAVVPPPRRMTGKSYVVRPHVTALVQACEAAADNSAIEILRVYCQSYPLKNENEAGRSLVYTALAELLKQRGNDGDISEALALLDDAVTEEHPGAMLHVGLCLRDGIGVPCDLSAALVWIERSADVGYAPAMFELGAMYEDGVMCSVSGDCLHVDWGEAVEWYHGAAERGHIMAQLNLGKLLWKAAEAAVEMTSIRWDEKNIDALRAKAHAWLESAASAGNEEAVRLLRCR